MIEQIEKLKHIDKNNRIYWNARELQKILEYKEWIDFKRILKKAIIRCKYNRLKTSNHFKKYYKIILLSNGLIKSVENYKLSRYACYLIIQNIDQKKTIALSLQKNSLSQMTN